MFLVVLSADSQSGEPQLKFYGWKIGQFSILTLWNLCSWISGGIKFWDLSWRLRHWRPEFNCCSDRILIYNFRANFDMWTLFEKRIKWGGSSLHGKTWRKIYESFKISSLSWLRVNFANVVHINTYEQHSYQWTTSS